MDFNRNCCDGIYNSFDIHFTSACDNKCEHCIDQKYEGSHIKRPNVDAIMQTILLNKEGYDDVLFLGGEPCLFLPELIDCVERIKKHTHLKVYVTTSVPKVCYDKKYLFYHLIGICDGINLSVQHYDEKIADEIRKTKSKFDRQYFYRNLPLKEKIRINLNIVKPYLYTYEDLVTCLYHYDRMGFNSIKLSEIQHGKEHFVSFEQVFELKKNGIRLRSPYYHGCQTYLDMSKLLPMFKTPVLLKRSCFLCEETLKASLMDGIKTVRKLVSKPNPNKYGVIYEDGSLSKGWK